VRVVHKVKDEDMEGKKGRGSEGARERGSERPDTVGLAASSVGIKARAYMK